MYPMLKDGVSMGTVQYEGSDTIHYYIENADGQGFEVNRRLWEALLDADGTHPLALPDHGRQILPQLKRRGLVQTSRFVQDAGFFNRFILFPIGERMRAGRPVFRVINAALPLVSVLLFAIGLAAMALKGQGSGDSFSLWLFYGLVALSLTLHELGHLTAGLAYGYQLSDAGILLFGLIPIGAYVAHGDSKHASKAEKVQFALAGIEVNLLVAGLCFLLAVQESSWSMLLHTVANANMILAGVNLLPASGLDGEAALSAACGMNSVGKAAKRWLVSKQRRKTLLRAGLPGYACLCMFSITLIAKAVLWLVIGFDVVLVFFRVF